MWDTLIVPRWHVHVISGIGCPMSMILVLFIYLLYLQSRSFTYFLTYQVIEVCFH